MIFLVELTTFSAPIVGTAGDFSWINTSAGVKPFACRVTPQHPLRLSSAGLLRAPRCGARLLVSAISEWVSRHPLIPGHVRDAFFLPQVAELWMRPESQQSLDVIVSWSWCEPCLSLLGFLATAATQLFVSARGLRGLSLSFLSFLCKWV